LRIYSTCTHRVNDSPEQLRGFFVFRAVFPGKIGC
jgi:hypothetical protein